MPKKKPLKVADETRLTAAELQSMGGKARAASLSKTERACRRKSPTQYA
jgi:hypothetical protein